MKAFRTQTESAEPSIDAHYLYDSAGQRVKKLVRMQGGQVEVTHYIDGAFEHHRWGSGAQADANNHVHVTDDTQRVALVRLGSQHPDDRGPAVQYHMGDHLGSSNSVVDANGILTNREEFTPYGESSFGSFPKKRYRFTGMERDEESGLSYHGARYYAPWFGRWTSCDPKGLGAGIDPYSYCSGNPIQWRDPSGLDSQTANALSNDELLHLSEANPIYVEGKALHEFDQIFWAESAGWIDLYSPSAFDWVLRYSTKQGSTEYAESWTPQERWDYAQATEAEQPEMAQAKSDELYLAYLRREAEGWKKTTDLMSGAANIGKLIGGVTAVMAGGLAAGTAVAPAGLIGGGQATGAGFTIGAGRAAQTIGTIGGGAGGGAALVNEIEEATPTLEETAAAGLQRVEQALSSLKEASEGYVKVVEQLEINGQRLMGLNGKWEANPPFPGLNFHWGHAEINGLGEAYRRVVTVGQNATMWVSEALCSSCLYVNVPNAVRQVGLASLTIHTRTETLVFTQEGLVEWIDYWWRALAQ
jgi:RHS repeat-associated protein